MILDAFQLLGLVLFIGGVWLMAPAGVALVLTGLAVIGAALLAESRAEG